MAAAIRSGEWDTYYERQYADRLAGGVAAERGEESAVPLSVDAAPARTPVGAGTAVVEAATEAQAHEPRPELG